MKIKPENVVRCGNDKCMHNKEGYYCAHIVVTLDTNGKCALANSRIKPKTISNTNTDPLAGSNAC